MQCEGGKKNLKELFNSKKYYIIKILHIFSNNVIMLIILQLIQCDHTIIIKACCTMTNELFYIILKRLLYIILKEETLQLVRFLEASSLKKKKDKTKTYSLYYRLYKTRL